MTEGEYQIKEINPDLFVLYRRENGLLILLGYYTTRAVAEVAITEWEALS